MKLKVSNILILTITIILPLIFTGCEENGTGSFACTTEFVTITLHVQNSNGEPVESADITVTNSATGSILEVCDSFQCNNGAMGDYVIFHDGFMDSISIEGDPYEVRGDLDDASFSEEYVFAKDRCHVLKKSGPDTVTVN